MDPNYNEPVSTQGPALPLEIYGNIIDLLCEPETGLELSKEQLSEVKQYSLVCKAFVPLCRKHIFKCIKIRRRFTQPVILSQFIRLLEGIRHYPRHIKIELIDYTSYMSSETTVPSITQALDALASLPFVESFALLALSPNRYSQETTPFGQQVYRLVERHLSNGIFRAFYVKRMLDVAIPGPAYASLHTLYFDRCTLSDLTQQLESVKSLTLNQMIVPASFILYFPALEEVRFHRCGFQHNPLSPIPPYLPPSGIRQLSVELGAPGSLTPLSTPTNTYGDWFFPLVEFLLEMSRRHNLDLFGQLRSLDVITTKYLSNVQVLLPITQDSSGLQSVWLKDNARESNRKISDVIDTVQNMMPTELPVRMTRHIGYMSYMSYLDGNVPPFDFLQYSGKSMVFPQKIKSNVGMFTPELDREQSTSHRFSWADRWCDDLEILTFNDAFLQNINELEVHIFHEEYASSDLWLDTIGRMDVTSMATHIEGNSSTGYTLTLLISAVNFR